MVEPPGIAPGSGPLITSAFIAISGASPGKEQYRRDWSSFQGVRSVAYAHPPRTDLVFAARPRHTPASAGL